MKKFIENIVENEPFYKDIKVTATQLIDLLNVKSFSVTQFCNTCKEIRTFKCDDNPFFQIKKEYDEECNSYPYFDPIEAYLETISTVMLFAFSCQHDCQEKHYCVIRLHNLTLTKIGQYPSFTKELVGKKLLKYKNLIPKYYPELTRAVSAYSQNMSVAGFVYLRRILEHLVDNKYSDYGNPEGVKFVDKLHEVEKHEKIIPDELDEIKSQIYTVLSKGVHEYLEEECVQLFPAVQFVIESILDEQLAAYERKKKASEAKKIIADKLKGDNK